jgi:hypothetical protein
MSAFEKLTGLVDQGPHRRYADYLLFPVPFCRTCGGRGCGGGNSAVYQCGPCGGGGRAFRPDSPEIAAIVKQILEYFPDAAKKPAPPVRQAPSPAPPAPVPKRLPTCFVAISGPRAIHPLQRIWSACKHASSRALDLTGAALLVFQVLTFSWATASLVISREFVWVLVTAPIGVFFTWLAILNAETVAWRWGTLSAAVRRKDASTTTGEEDEDVYPWGRSLA